MFKNALFTLLTFFFLFTPLAEAQNFLNTKKILNPPNPSFITKDKYGNNYAAYNFSGTLVIDTFHFTAQELRSNLAIVKFDSAGHCTWARQVISRWQVSATCLVCDSEGNIIIAGGLSDSTFFDTITIPGYAYPMDSDMFIAKYSPQGRCLWARGFGGSGDDIAATVSLDSVNNIFVAGTISGVYPGYLQFDSIIVSPPSGYQICILKLNPLGKVSWVKTPGGNGWERAYSLKFKPNGRFVVSGFAANNAIFDTITLRFNGVYKIFIAEYNSSAVCEFVTYAGGGPENYGYNIDIDKTGNIFLSGLCGSNAYFDSIYLPTNPSIYLNSFVAKYSPLKKCIWVKSPSISDFQKVRITSIAADYSGNCYVTGWFRDTLSIDRMQVISKGGKDIFFAKFGPTGICIGLVRAGGTGDDGGSSISYSPSGLITATGFFSGTADFGTTVLTGGGTFSTQFSDITTGTDGLAISQAPKKEVSFSGYPNPFQQSVLLQFTLPEDSYVTLTMYNIQGEKVYCAANQFYSKGQSSVEFNPKGLSSGMYIAELQTKFGTQRIKLMNIR